MNNHHLPSLDPSRLATLAIEALERTAFVLADPAERPEALPEAEIAAEIRFHGPESGRVGLHASRAFARNLAASLLGCDAAEIRDEQADEALRELANIVAGSVLSSLGGDDCRFSLGLPETILPESALRDGSGATRCILDAEGERLEITCRHHAAA
jgi:CheY-specific phosphatase CheX